jgi:hypothetical protein
MEMGVRGTLSPAQQETVNKYKLISDGLVTHYVIATFRREQVLMITAEGVDYLCRKEVKSAHIIGDPIIDRVNGVPMTVTIKIRVETFSGQSFDDLGSVEVTDGLPKAIKHAVTNGKTRALRSAIGIKIPDETLLKELNQDEQQSR